MTKDAARDTCVAVLRAFQAEGGKWGDSVDREPPGTEHCLFLLIFSLALLPKKEARTHTRTHALHFQENEHRLSVSK